MTSRGPLLNGRYALERLLGRGGFAEVFVAVDETTRERVAIKLFRETPAGSGRIASRIDGHPHIVSLRDHGTHEARHFEVFDYIEGPTLRQQLEESKRLSSEAVARLASEIGSALDHAHSRGVVHNDLKPENIILGPNGGQLLDFGSARAIDATVTIEAAQQLAGTVRYMAPEVLDGGEPNVQSDVYSFGMVLFEALTGTLPRHPISGAELAGTSSLPPGYSTAFTRALSQVPEMRHQSAGMLAEALQPGQSTRVIGTPRSRPGATPRLAGGPAEAKTRSMRPVALGLVGAAVLFGVIGFAAATSMTRDGDPTTATEPPPTSPTASATTEIAAEANTAPTAVPPAPAKPNENAEKPQPKGKAKGKK